jgi:hypothetical protein
MGADFCLRPFRVGFQLPVGGAVQAVLPFIYLALAFLQRRQQNHPGKPMPSPLVSERRLVALTSSLQRWGKTRPYLNLESLSSMH